nr:hypothetical protein [Cytobacillus oceanisediminis]
MIKSRNMAALKNTVLADSTSVMNIGIILGAFNFSGSSRKLQTR